MNRKQKNRRPARLAMRTALAALLTLLTLSGRADEGMWVVGNLSEKTDSILMAMGLEISPEDIYSEERPSLNDAIVNFGGFCSGVVVSAEGLVFTNHHCGFSSVQDHSDTRHDYLKNGFYAKTLKDELPNEGLYVLFHIKTVDVTPLVMKAAPEGEVPGDSASTQADAAISERISELTRMVSHAGRGVVARVNSFYKGSKYYLSVYQRYDDVRLVYAPPQGLGKYGGETDNWMWPRHTCDFSVFRVYAASGNTPAAYSAANVPYRPRNWAVVSTQGYSEGSFAMTLGYPGSTDRYLSSYGVESVMRTENDVRYATRDVKLNILREVMRSSDSLRIKYASKYATSSNYWKFSLGQNQALENLRVVDEKRQTEAALMDWVAQGGEALARYAGLTDTLRNAYREEYENNYAATLWIEALYSGSDILGFALTHTRSSPVDRFAEEVRREYRDIDVPTDKRLFLAMLRHYIDHAPANYRLAEVEREIDSLWAGDCARFVDNLYATSLFADPQRLAQVKDISELNDDPMMKVALDARAIFADIYSQEHRSEPAEKLLGDALREMEPHREFYPDANMTMRLSYGLCKPITFRPGTMGLKDEATLLTTTPRAFLDKHRLEPQNPDFQLTAPVLRWMTRGKFSPRYLDPATGQLPLCFLTTNDITGGNSGSGIFDSRGRLIGLAFDGNWEAMSGDLKFDNALQRCIGVDIRWVLAVIDNYSHAKRLMRELTLDN